MNHARATFWIPSIRGAGRASEPHPREVHFNMTAMYRGRIPSGKTCGYPGDILSGSDGLS
ncbi:hypothetical protein F2P79_009680 [Pimephales promelas]|nr:hypothetical protein F2P79_009680 [Pimephales promelas]